MGAARWATQPDQTTGYTRAANRSNSEKGSGMGPAPANAMAAWHPTVRVLLLLVIGELVAYGALRSFTKHGG
jgi:hypothetical protein